MRNLALTIIGGEGGSSLDINSDVGFGINIAYNLNSKISVGADFEFLRPNYRAVLVPVDSNEDDIVINHKISQFNGRLKGTFNMIDGPFTPFLEATSTPTLLTDRQPPDAGGIRGGDLFAPITTLPSPRHSSVTA